MNRWSGISGNHCGGVKDVLNKLMGSSHLVPAYAGSVWGVLNKGAAVPASTSVLARAAPLALAPKPDNSVSPHIFWWFLSCCPFSRA